MLRLQCIDVFYVLAVGFSAGAEPVFSVFGEIWVSSASSKAFSLLLWLTYFSGSLPAPLRRFDRILRPSSVVLITSHTVFVPLLHGIRLLWTSVIRHHCQWGAFLPALSCLLRVLVKQVYVVQKPLLYKPQRTRVACNFTGTKDGKEEGSTEVCPV